MAMVGFLIREFGRPEVAARVDQVANIPANIVPAAMDPEKIGPSPAQAPADPTQFRRLLDLAGWNAARFATLQKNAPPTEDDRQQLAELLWRLRTFDGPQLTDWARAGASFATVAAAPVEHAGQLVALTGRVTKAQRRVLPADLAKRLEMPTYVECEMTLDGGVGVATLITARVPKAWLKTESLDEPAAAAGVFIQLLPSTEGPPHGLFVSREIAWHPATPREPIISLGKSVLGAAGVDIGQLDSIRQRRAITGDEREAFYQMLDAAGRLGANQLTRFAQQDLSSVQARWAAEAKQLAEAKSPDRARLRLAQDVERHAARGTYSVAPLFNDAANQVGSLVTLDGTVRRVTRIDVGTSPDGSPSDVARRFGIDHYYELDVFTEDSQNNPIVFVVRELPPGFPTGDGLHEPVRISGFFFKSWSFQSRRANLPVEAEDHAPENLRQFAPLLIGRGPIMLQQPEPSRIESFGLIAAGLFVLVLGAVWAAGWWLAREDRRFVRSTLADQFSVPHGESLNDLDFDLSEPPRENE
jgi:hypothetical protein